MPSSFKAYSPAGATRKKAGEGSGIRSMDLSNRPIGVFDSGVGGISTLAAMVKILPGEQFLYLGDTLHAPYGTKTTEEVPMYVRRVVSELLQHGDRRRGCHASRRKGLPGDRH